MNNFKVMMNGIIKENPTFVLLLGMCPTLGTTSSAINGMGMGLATMFVLICSNVVISLIKNLIPDMVRIPSFIVVIASFVTLLQMVMQAYVPGLYATLGLFIPLIVVNCIVLGRAQAFAAKNNAVASMFDGIGMGLATTFVLVCSNFVISLLKNVIPKAVRLPCFIVIIAGFVTLIEFLMKGYIPELYSALGVFLSLITVNCIILGRAEAFASKNKIFPSILDGLGMGLGFTLSLFTMGSIREILGTGSWFGFKIPFLCDDPMTVFIMPAGGFFVLGCLIALVNKIANKKPPKEISCSGCPNAALCKGQCRTESEEA